MIGIIYKVTNIVNGKIYIGQTTKSLNTRKLSHINDSLAIRDNLYFHNAIRKYGINNFKWEVLESCASKEELDDMEFHFIKQFNSKAPAGYNMTEGGGGMLGYIITEEHRKNLSDSHKGYIHTDQQKERISNALKGRKLSEDAKKRLSKSKMGEKNPMYGIKGPNNHSYGITPPKHVFDALVKRMSQQYVVVFPDGHEEEIINLSAFCRKYKLNKGNLCSTAHGRRSHHKGFKCHKMEKINYE